MEHPYLFFVKIFEAIGLGHFAHTYPHVVYSWVLMAILIIAGAIATKTISMIPGKAQNLFEVIVLGIEEFMVETAGEEARWLFPLAATIFLYIFIGNRLQQRFSVSKYVASITRTSASRATSNRLSVLPESPT